MHTKIEKTIKKYLRAFYQQDFDTIIDMLYTDDKKEYRDTFVDFAQRMDIFGETDDFLRKMQIENIAALKKLSVDEFILGILKLVTREIGEKELKRMIKGTRITNIDNADLLTIVRYEIPIYMFGEWDKLESEITMILIGSEWKLFFKSGLRAGLQQFQDEIDLYQERKAKDDLSKLEHEDDLTTYTLTGYKNMAGEIVFNARFKDAGNFSDGLAYVQIMRKYGYINLKGKIAIKAQFEEASDFSQKLAGVKIRTPKARSGFWGFINKKGKVVIAPKYRETLSFNEGLCAVREDEHWGYINKKGEVIIPLQFTNATNFDSGSAYVEFMNNEGKNVELLLNKEGKIIG